MLLYESMDPWFGVCIHKNSYKLLTNSILVSVPCHQRDHDNFSEFFVVKTPDLKNDFKIIIRSVFENPAAA
jgi:hypothetical protein